VTSSGGELDSSVAGSGLQLNSGQLDVDDGSGSNLDADTLDGNEGTYYKQTLGNAMTQGNTASTGLDMSGYGIQNAQAVDIQNPLTDGNISDTISISSSGIVAAGAVSGTLSDSQVTDALTVSSSGSVDDRSLTNGGTLSYDWQDNEVVDSLTVSSTGSVDPAAIGSSIAGNELGYSSGTLNVDEGSGSGLTADQLDGNEASASEEESHAGEHDGAGLSNPSGDTLDVNTGNALTINSDNVAVAANGVGNSELDNAANFDMTGQVYVSSGTFLLPTGTDAY